MSLEERGNSGFDGREVRGDDIPDNGIINTEIAMDYPIAERCHFTPWNVGALLFYRFRDVFSCFTNYFKSAPDGMWEIIIMDQVVRVPPPGDLI